MSYRTILVHLESIKQSANLLAGAVALAQQHNAHLIGMYVVPMPQAHVTADLPMPVELIQEHMIHHQKLCEAMKEEFEKATSSVNFISEWREVDADTITIADTLTEIARTVDLLIMSQKESQTGDYALHDLPEAVILACSRPVIVIPKSDALPKAMSDVFVAWDGGAQATRAVFDALPILREADNVRVHRINIKGKDRHKILNTTSELVNTLSRHGANVTLSDSTARPSQIGDEIVGSVKESGCDLLVMGTYGHTRFREIIFGGVTRKVLQVMSVPVLMAH